MVPLRVSGQIEINLISWVGSVPNDEPLCQSEMAFSPKLFLDVALRPFYENRNRPQWRIAPSQSGVELMAQWQAIALNIKPKRKPSEYMDPRFVNEAMEEFGQK